MTHRKKAGFIAVGALLLAALIEFASFSFGAFFAPDMFSGEETYFASIDAEKFSSWQASPWFDAELGWNTPAILTGESKRNCLGKDISYVYREEYRGIPRDGIPAVALIGDSFTFGDEVDDDSTSAAALERMIDAPVLNYGVRAFGPDQSVLKFERLAQKRLMPNIAVLIIMHENIRRVVNSFRPVYYSVTDMRFGLKPFITGQTLVEISYPQNYAEFVEQAQRSFAEDFWARPRFRFPYALSLLKAVMSNAYYLTRIASRGRKLFSYEYGTENPLRTALTTAIDRWRASVLAQGGKPFGLFIPNNHSDYGVAAAYVAILNAAAGKTFAFDFDDPKMDWRYYNLKPGQCHPSPYGQERIALFIASQILTPSLIKGQ
jgi:hypothetical protein